MEILKQILTLKGEARKITIQKFQNYIWNEKQLPFEEITVELLRDLAYDLDFCATDENIDKEIIKTLDNLQKLNSPPN
jgi:hypothetical protein